MKQMELEFQKKRVCTMVDYEMYERIMHTVRTEASAISQVLRDALEFFYLYAPQKKKG